MLQGGLSWLSFVSRTRPAVVRAILGYLIPFSVAAHLVALALTALEMLMLSQKQEERGSLRTENTSEEMKAGA